MPLAHQVENSAIGRQLAEMRAAGRVAVVGVTEARNLEGLAADVVIKNNCGAILSYKPLDEDMVRSGGGGCGCGGCGGCGCGAGGGAGSGAVMPMSTQAALPAQLAQVHGAAVVFHAWCWYRKRRGVGARAGRGLY